VGWLRPHKGYDFPVVFLSRRCGIPALSPNASSSSTDDVLILRNLKRILDSAGFDVRTYSTPRTRWPPSRPTVHRHHLRLHDAGHGRQSHSCRGPGEGALGARILCTAAEDFRIALDAVNSGEVYRIISKPWHNQEVVTTVAQAADASRLRRENERSASRSSSRTTSSGAERPARGAGARAHRGAPRGLIAALDYRDAETQWHSRRVSSTRGGWRCSSAWPSPTSRSSSTARSCTTSEDRHPRSRAPQAGAARRRRVEGDEAPPELGWSWLAGRVLEERLGHRAAAPGEVGRHGLPGRPAGRQHPRRRAGVPRRGRLRRDHQRPPVPEGARLRGGPIRDHPLPGRAVRPQGGRRLPRHLREEWRRISIDVEQYAILSIEMAGDSGTSVGPLPLAQA